MELRVADSVEEIEGARRVRRKVFVEEQGVPEELELDAVDAIAIHLVLLSQGEVVATARVYEQAGEWHAGRVAVLQEWRGQGIGTRMMELAAAVAYQQGADHLTLNAQLAVIPFYERLGYQAIGEVFSEAGILHRTMRGSGA